MGKWFLDFSFWIQGYRTVQRAHCALYILINMHADTHIDSFREKYSGVCNLLQVFDVAKWWRPSRWRPRWWWPGWSIETYWPTLFRHILPKFAATYLFMTELWLWKCWSKCLKVATCEIPPTHLTLSLSLCFRISDRESPLPGPAAGYSLAGVGQQQQQRTLDFD